MEENERERNVSSSCMLSTFERFVTREGIMEAVKWACVNMPAVKEHGVVLPASQSPKVKSPNKGKGMFLKN